MNKKQSCILQAASEAAVELSDSTAGPDLAFVSAACARHQHGSGRQAGLPPAAADLYSTHKHTATYAFITDTAMTHLKHSPCYHINVTLSGN